MPEVQAELHHRDRHVGLDPDDHGLRAAQPRRQDDRAQRPRDKGVDDVERGYIDDDPASAAPAHELRKLFAKF